MLEPILIVVNEMILRRDLEFLQMFGDRKGTDKPYQEWLKDQPCKRCGAVPHYEMDTKIFNMPVHVREVSMGSGTGIKPPWNVTSMCFDCHGLEHQSGRDSIAPVETLRQWADESLCLYVLGSLRANLGQHWLKELPQFLSDNLVDR